MLLRLDNVSKSFGGRTLFSGVALGLRAGDRFGLVGPNGAGKTTLLRIAAGVDSADGGQVIRSRGLRLGLLGQEIDPGRDQSVRAEAASALVRLDGLERELRTLETEMAGLGRAGRDVPAELAARYDRARAAFELGGGFERDTRIDRVLAGLGFEEEDRERPLRSFSGGWLMRVELAKLLLSDPDVLLLDEPTNHLDLPSIQWFEAFIAQFRGAVIAISHDRTFLRRHTRRIVELDQGRFCLYEGGFDGYLRERAERRAALAAAKRNQDRKIAETERFIERFRYKASKARQVQSRVHALERLERIELPSDSRRRIRLAIPPAERAGAVVVELSDIHKRYGQTVVYRGVDLKLRRGDRVALVGPNGAGKSTLLRILAGALPFEHGERRLGHNVQVAFYAQHQLDVLAPEDTVLAALGRDARFDDTPRLRGHLGAFLFSGDDVEKKVSVLSGGEKARLCLAKLLLRPVNFLVLDEPTNHLDVDACEVLEDALGGTTGTLAFISHDRSFINSLATRVVEVRAGNLREFPGNYDDYLAKLAELEGAAATRGAVTGHGAPRGAAAENEASPPPGREAQRERRRLSRERQRSRERTAKRLAAIEAEVLEREAALEELGLRLADPAAHRDGERLRALELARRETQAAIDALVRDWERVAGELESLDDGAR